MEFPQMLRVLAKVKTTNASDVNNSTTWAVSEFSSVVNYSCTEKACNYVFRLKICTTTSAGMMMTCIQIVQLSVLESWIQKCELTNLFCKGMFNNYLYHYTFLPFNIIRWLAKYPLTTGSYKYTHKIQVCQFLLCCPCLIF